MPLEPLGGLLYRLVEPADISRDGTTEALMSG
jgi:hypothetical protein